MPFFYTYQPLLHHINAALSAAAGWSDARAFHASLALFYSLGPVTLYALAYRLSRRPAESAAAALVYSLCSPSAFLIPRIAEDLGSPWFARRLHAGVVYADGPEIAALTLLPLAVLLLDVAFEKGRVLAWLGASIGIAAVFLTNIPASISLLLAISAWILSGDPPRWIRRALSSFGAIVLGFCLFAPWLPPSGLLQAATNTQWMDSAGRFHLQRAGIYAAILATVVGGAWLLARWNAPLAARFATLFTTMTAVITLPKAWFDVSLIAQAMRFHIVMEMALALLVAVAASAAVRRWPPLAAVFLTLLAIAVPAQIVHYRQFARHTIQPAAIDTRSETKVARWIADHAHGARVMAAGATAFWLNALTDTPQLTGCCDQNLLLRSGPMVKWELGTDTGAGDQAGEISIAWLEALGVRYVAVNGPRSTDVYKDFAHPDKFAGLLPEVWRDGDDVIYAVPPAEPSLAHVVQPGELVATEPVNAVDVAPLARYRQAILDPDHPQAKFRWKNMASALVDGEVPHGYRLSVQIPYHAGWRASTAGRRIPIEQDALGLMVVDPRCGGPCQVELVFDGGTEQRTLTVVMAVTWAAALVLLWRSAAG